MIKAVIFDMDGVLLDTEKHFEYCWTKAAREAGFPFEKEHAWLLRSLAAKFAEPLMKSIFGEKFDFGSVRERRKELMTERLLEYGLEKKPGVDEILDYLKQLGIKTAVATATEPVCAKDYLMRVGIYDKFDYVVSAHTVKNGKPMPDIYLYACEMIKEEPKDCLAIEDSPNGVLAAVGAGIPTVMVPDRTEPDEELLSILHYCVSDLLEIKTIVK